MPDTALTGSRIRRRRLDLGLRQTDLAELAGISAPYLNLIEYNRRRIGGRLLNTLARLLDIEPALLAEGAGAGVTSALRRAAASLPEAGAEVSLAEDFTGRFPGWARLVAAQAGRIEQLGDEVDALADRLGHDPALAASLHEMISAVTSIRATASILASGEPVDPDWQARFHRNIHADSRRLADESRALAAYLEATPEMSTRSPQEELEAALERHDQHFAALEGPGAAGAAEVARGLEGLSSAARALAQDWFATYRADAAALPLAGFSALALDCGHDPAALAAATGRPMAQVLRRLSCLPPAEGHPAFGLAIADAAGALLRCRTLPGLALPRLGICPLWPLFAAFGQPFRPIEQHVALPGERGAHFLAQAVAEPVEAPRFDAPSRLQAVMLLRPVARGPAGGALPVGPSCRICARSACPARRETPLLPN